MEEDHPYSVLASFEADEFIIDSSAVDKLCSLMMQKMGLPPGSELSLSFLDKNEMRCVNFETRGIDKATDVLSFPQSEFSHPLPSASETYQYGSAFLIGDIVIAPEVAEQNAKNIGQSLAREVLFLLVHGLLHLLGHDHEISEDEAQMQKEQHSLIEFLEKTEYWIKNGEGLIKRRKKVNG